MKGVLSSTQKAILLKQLLWDTKFVKLNFKRLQKCSKFNFVLLLNTKINSTDIEALIDAFSNPNLARERGIYFNEINYACLRADEDSIYAKNGNKGLVMVQTLKCVLMATYGENMYPSVCVEAVEKLGNLF